MPSDSILNACLSTEDLLFVFLVRAQRLPVRSTPGMAFRQSVVVFEYAYAWIAAQNVNPPCKASLYGLVVMLGSCRNMNSRQTADDNAHALHAPKHADNV